MSNIKVELFRDNYQNFKSYNIPKAQLVIADIPYNLGESDGENASADQRKHCIKLEFVERESICV